MKRWAVILITLSVFAIVPNALAEPFNEAWLFSENRGFDSSDFPIAVAQWPLLIAAARIDSTDPVSQNVVVTPIPGSVSPQYLPYQIGWDAFIRGWMDSPANLNNWEQLYTFQCGTDTRLWLIPQGSLRQIDFPTPVSLDENILSWSPVPYATNYQVYIFSLDNNGYPDLLSGPIWSDGPLTTTSTILPTDLPSMSYAVSIDSMEWNPEAGYDNFINRSRYSIKYTIRPQSIPTMNEWGVIIMSLILASSALWMIRRRQTP